MLLHAKSKETKYQDCFYCTLSTTSSRHWLNLIFQYLDNSHSTIAERITYQKMRDLIRSIRHSAINTL